MEIQVCTNFVDQRNPKTGPGTRNNTEMTELHKYCEPKSAGSAETHK